MTKTVRKTISGTQKYFLTTLIVCVSVCGVMSEKLSTGTVGSTTKAVLSEVLPNSAKVMAALRCCGERDGDKIPNNSGWFNGPYNMGYFKYFLTTQELVHYNRSKSSCDRVNWFVGVTDSQSSGLEDATCPLSTFLWHYQLQPAYYKIHDVERVYNIVVAFHSGVSPKGSPRDRFGMPDWMFMVMPWMSAAGKATGNTLYWDKLYAWWKNNLDSGCFRSSTKLWHYNNSVRLTPNGKEAAWARAQAWAGGAICLTLENLAPTHPGYPVMRGNLAAFCEGIRNTQTAEGYWTACPTDWNWNGHYESSGTAGMVYTLAWAINNGVVDRASYMPAVAKGWNWLANTALQPKGSIGYSQGPSGSDRGGGGWKTPNVKSTSNYTQGFFMMAGSEVIKLCADYVPPKPLKIPDSPPADLSWKSDGWAPRVAIHRSGWDPQATLVATKGGSPSHNDIGSFILDALGVRWSEDLSMGSYDFPKQVVPIIRWNALVVNDQLQVVQGKSEIMAFKKDGPFPHTVLNLTPVYEGQLKSAVRGIGLREDRSVLVQDDLLATEKKAIVRWGMVTRSEVKITGDGTATLKQNGKELDFRVLSPSGVKLKIYDTEIPRSKVRTQMIGFEVTLSPSTTQRLAVLLTPGEKAGTLPKLKALKEW